MLQYITPADWAEFERQFPTANGFLLQKSLEGELRHLEELEQKNVASGELVNFKFQQSRLAELREWKKSISRQKELIVY